MGIYDRMKGVSRRDFFKIAGTYGMSSTLLAAGTLGGAMTAANLANAAESQYNRRYAKEAKHQLKFGAAGFNQDNLLIERAGCLEFVRDLEERTDGEIRVEFIGNNQICGQLSAVLRKAQQGIIDHLCRLDPELGRWRALSERAGLCLYVPQPGRSVLLHVLPRIAEASCVIRSRRCHGLKFLFTHAELRGIQLGLAWEDKETVTSIDQLAGTKNRVTGTQLGPHRDECAQPEPGAGGLGRNPRRPQAGPDRRR